VCLFDEAKQKPRHGGSSFSLGYVDNAVFDQCSKLTKLVCRRFQGWNVSATPGMTEYYTKQAYTGGARCWNGPERSVSVRPQGRLGKDMSSHRPFCQLVLSCGTQNQLTSAVELEKCEYQITGTTPALCLPLDESEGSPRDDSEL
jgi:protein kinase C substrate 80K-H